MTRRTSSPRSETMATSPRQLLALLPPECQFYPETRPLSVIAGTLHREYLDRQQAKVLATIEPAQARCASTQSKGTPPTMTDPTTPPQGPAAGQPQQPYAAPTPGAPLTAAEDRQWAMWSHIGGVAVLFWAGWLPPLILWLVFKDRGALTR